MNNDYNLTYTIWLISVCRNRIFNVQFYHGVWFLFFHLHPNGCSWFWCTTGFWSCFWIRQCSRVGWRNAENDGHRRHHVLLSGAICSPWTPAHARAIRFTGGSDSLERNDSVRASPPITPRLTRDPPRRAGTEAVVGALRGYILFRLSRGR